MDAKEMDRLDEQFAARQRRNYAFSTIETKHALELLKLARKGLTAEELERQIEETREACPLVRTQEFMDVPLLEVVQEQVSRQFAAESELKTAMEVLAKAKDLVADLSHSRDDFMVNRTRVDIKPLKELVAALSTGESGVQRG